MTTYCFGVNGVSCEQTRSGGRPRSAPREQNAANLEIQHRADGVQDDVDGVVAVRPQSGEIVVEVPERDDRQRADRICDFPFWSSRRPKKSCAKSSHNVVFSTSKSSLVKMAL